jgi:hypothetical protein
MVKVGFQDKMQIIGCISSNLCTRLSRNSERGIFCPLIPTQQKLRLPFSHKGEQGFFR